MAKMNPCVAYPIHYPTFTPKIAQIYYIVEYFKRSCA